MSALLNDTSSRSINIDLISSFATKHISSCHKEFKLSSVIIPPVNSSILIGVQAFSMPYSFYLVELDKNDTFTIQTYNGAVYKTVNFTIPSGNYDDRSFIIELNTLFTAVSDDLGCLLTVYADYTKEQLYLISDTLLDSITFKNITCYKLFGFSSSDDYSFENTTTLRCPNNFNFSGNSTLYIQLANQSITNRNSLDKDGIIASIYCDVLPTEIIYYKPIEVSYFKSSPLDILDISILDENMEEIELNGSIFRLTLTIHFAYNKPENQLPEDKITVSKFQKIMENNNIN